MHASRTRSATPAISSGSVFSRGGQIIIARRIGEKNPDEVGRTFYAILYFELVLALFMFLFME